MQTGDDLTIDKLINLHNAIARLLRKLDTPTGIELAVRRFKMNAERLAMTSSLPWELMHDYVIHGFVMHAAVRKASNGRVWSFDDLTNGQQRLAVKYCKEMGQELEEKAAKKRGIERALSISNAKAAFKRAVSQSPLSHRTGLCALMASIIVGAWTAFEAITEDLWVAALNVRPTLALVAMDAEIKQSDKEKERRRKEGVKLSLPIWKAMEPNYNISEHLGDLTRDCHDWSRRGDAQRAYEKVFPAFGVQLESIFQSSGLKWLNATRNAIVHNRSVADNEFVKLVGAHPHLKVIADGTEIPIDGAITYELSMAGIKSCINIIDFVGQRIKSIAQ